ncbi:MaoC family dehydratase N-terminal domain-containing protein [Streptomyces sp. NPDC088812]|uniref:FAS1-like dehydratase domain-containing protein n=1 Tax=Streptomyces sp. NPDC088812 TaxID=3365905 RepID=UPI00382F5C88
MTEPILLTDALRRRLTGRTAVYTAPEELGRAAIRYFALATGNGDPLHLDPAYARAHGHPDVVAPPTLVCETNQYAGLPPDADGYAGHTWGVDVPGTRAVRGGNAYTFHRPVRPDDRITATWTLTSVTERTTGGRLPMLVVRSHCAYTSGGELLAENEETMLYIALTADPPATPAPAASGPPTTSPPTASGPPATPPPGASGPPTASSPPTTPPPTASSPPATPPPGASGPPTASSPPTTPPPTAADAAAAPVPPSGEAR